VATEKRQRQEENRLKKVAEQQVVAQKEQAVKKRKKLGMYALIGLGLVGLVFLLSRCGNSSDGSDPVNDTAAPTSTVGVTVPVDPALKTKPKISIPDGAAPKTLQSKDTVVGKGAAVVEGDTVEVRYVGVSWSTKKEFDSSWSRGDTFKVTPVGKASVITGWNQGLIGMREGGRRQLTIPPDLAYGAEGSPPNIKANETLVFVIDVVKVTKNNG
jgi:peptidylprolyl isomerase